MKKFLILCICFFLFSCEKQNPTIKPEEIKIENISHKENPHQKCADNSPLKANDLPKIYWTFENENDKKCWHLGYIDRNFFLTNEDDFLVKHATGEHFNEIEWKKGNWEHFDGTYGNLLYGSYEKIFQQLQKDLNKDIFHEIPSFHTHYPNTLEHFANQLKANKIVLPNNAISIQDNIDIGHINSSHLDGSEIKNIEDLYTMIQEKQKTNTNGEKIISEKENAKICIQKLDKNFFEENKNKGSNATLQAFQHNTNCYYILIEKNTLPLYLVFSFDDTNGTKNIQNGAYYFFDSINMQDFDGHDYIPIQGDFINSLDNLLIENNLSIPKISYNLEDDLKNGYFISNSIKEANYENILKKIWEYRNSKNYFEQKNFFKNEDRKLLDDIKSELQNLKECGMNCGKQYKKIYEQYVKAQKIFGE